MRRANAAAWMLLCLALLAPATALAADRPEVAALNQRLLVLQANPELAGFASYERLRAEQAVAELVKARGRSREAALYLADRRVATAETVARTERARAEAQRLERTRNELLLEASRRDAARARAEAERLRIQAQIRAEEVESLQRAAEAEALARQQAEEGLATATGEVTQRLGATRRREMDLARQEAELVSGAKLPASRQSERGEVFTLAAAAFEPGQSRLSSAGAAHVSALAAYLEARPKSRATVQGYGDRNTPGRRRAEALRDALVAAGVASRRLSTAAAGEGTKAKAAEVVVSE